MILFLLPSLIGVLLFYILPFFATLYYAFSQGVVNVHFVGFANFVALFKNPSFLLAFKNTLLFIGLAVPTTVLCALLISLKLQENLNSKARLILLTPMVLPVATAVAGWRMLFAQNSISTQILSAISGEQLYFWDGQLAFYTILFIFIVKNIGYMSIVFTGALTRMPKEYQEAFYLDTRSTVKYTYKIVLPLIAPVISFVSVLCVVNAFLIFREIYAVYGNHPPRTLYFIQYFMNNNFYKLNYNRLSSVALVVVVLITVVIALALYYQDKKAVKYVK